MVGGHGSGRSRRAVLARGTPEFDVGASWAFGDQREDSPAAARDPGAGGERNEYAVRVRLASVAIG
jgi:hypothetical protein